MQAAAPSKLQAYDDSLLYRASLNHKLSTLSFRRNVLERIDEWQTIFCGLLRAFCRHKTQNTEATAYFLQTNYLFIQFSPTLVFVVAAPSPVPASVRIDQYCSNLVEKG